MLEHIIQIKDRDLMYKKDMSLLLNKLDKYLGKSCIIY